MGRNTRIAVEPVDQDDPTLAVDGLVDLFPFAARKMEIDSTLTVGTAGELFDEEDAYTADDTFSGYFADADADDVSMTTAADDVPTATPVDGEAYELTRSFGSGQVFERDDDFQSDTQRAALEFQRFAEKFHEFATECAQR